MTKRLTFNKINRWIIFILALVPILFVLLSVLKLHFADTETIGMEKVIEEFSISFNSVNLLLHQAVSEIPWYDSLYQILSRAGFTGSSGDVLVLLCYNYFNYLFELMFLDLVFQCFTFFISLIRNAVEKLGGDF